MIIEDCRQRNDWHMQRSITRFSC